MALIVRCSVFVAMKFGAWPLCDHVGHDDLREDIGSAIAVEVKALDKGVGDAVAAAGVSLALGWIIAPLRFDMHPGAFLSFPSRLARSSC